MLHFNDKEKVIAKELLENLNFWANGKSTISFSEREDELDSQYGKSLVSKVKELLIDEDFIEVDCSVNTGLTGYSESMSKIHITQKGINFLKEYNRELK